MVRPVLALVLCGCSAAEVPQVAWRTGAASLPASSRAGLAASIEAVESGQIDGIHLDLFVASDRTPVVSHNAYMDPDTCTSIDGKAVDEDDWIFLLSSETVTASYLCGGQVDPDFPDQEAVAGTPLAYDEILSTLEAAPATTVVLEARWFPNVSHSPDVYAAELLERWAAADLEHHTLLVASEQAGVLQAVRTRSPVAEVDVETWFVWPRMPPLGWKDGIVARDVLLADAGLGSPAAQAVEAEADGLVLSWEEATRRDLEAASAEGLQVGLQTGAGPAASRQASRWPVDVLWSAELSW